MNQSCQSVREWMLQADPAELRGEGDGEHAAHLRGCAECQRQARLFLAGQDELAAALGMLSTPSREPDVIPLRARRAWMPRLAATAAGLTALAAALAGVLLLRPPPAATPGATTAQIARLLFPAAPVARALHGESVAVLATHDPDVTVVWVY